MALRARRRSTKLSDALSRAVVIGPKTNLAFPERAAGFAAKSPRRARHRLHRRAFERARRRPREPERAATLAAAEAFWRERAAGQGVASSIPGTSENRSNFRTCGATPLEVKVDGHVEKLVVEAKGGATRMKFADGRRASGAPTTLFRARRRDFRAQRRPPEFYCARQSARRAARGRAGRIGRNPRADARPPHRAHRRRGRCGRGGRSAWRWSRR